MLLIQAGAPVEQELSDRRGHKTILMAYIQRCRSAIIPVVVAQLYRIFRHRPSSDIITPNTEYYITGVGKTSSARRLTLLQDMRLSSGIDAATCLAVEIVLGRETSTSTMRPSQSNELSVERSPTSTESTALLPSQLPVGWIAHRVNNKNGPGKNMYEEVFTQSFTLMKPGVACSLVQRGEIKIGDVGTNRVVSFLTLPSLLQEIGGVDGGGAVRSDIAARFLMYDESWFRSEWLLDLQQVDVLGTINPWKLPSFTIRIPNLNIMETISFNLRWLAGGIWSLIEELAGGIWSLIENLAGGIWMLIEELAPLLAPLAFCVAAAVLLPFLLWFFVPLFLFMFLAWGPFFLNAYMLASSGSQGNRSSIALGLPFTFAFIPGGVIIGALIVQAICSDTPDGITYDGKACKQCIWVAFEYIGCNPKDT
jgi:hypothetical protein